jgi:hypothetical protein
MALNAFIKGLLSLLRSTILNGEPMKKLLITSVLLFSALHLKASYFYGINGRNPWGEFQPMPTEYYNEMEAAEINKSRKEFKSNPTSQPAQTPTSNTPIVTAKDDDDNKKIQKKIALQKSWYERHKNSLIIGGSLFVITTSTFLGFLWWKRKA